MTNTDRENVARFVILGIIAAVYTLWKRGVPFNYAVAIVIVGITVLSVAYQLHRRAHYRALLLSDIDNMDGLEFERYVQKLLEWRGFKVTLTPASGDFGVDLIAKDNQDRYAVQAKCYRRQPVSVHAIGEVVGGMNHYNCNRSMVITNNRFTKPARSLAKSNSTILVDRSVLAQWINEFTNQRATKPAAKSRYSFLDLPRQISVIALATVVLVLLWFLARPIISVTATIPGQQEYIPTMTPTVEATVLPSNAIATINPKPTPTNRPLLVTESSATPIWTVDDETQIKPGNSVVLYDSNLRSGPGTDYEIVGSVFAGDSVTIVTCNEGCEWLQLDQGEWIAAFLLGVTSDN